VAASALSPAADVGEEGVQLLYARLKSHTLSNGLTQIVPERIHLSRYLFYTPIRAQGLSFRGGRVTRLLIVG